MSINEYSRTKRPHPLGLSFEDHWKKQAGTLGGDFALGEAGRLHSKIVSAFDVLADFEDHPSPKVNKIEHAERREKLANDIVKKLASDHSRVSKAISDRRTRIREEINTELGLIERSSAAEIRSVLRQMTSEQRAACIHKAIDTKDSEILSAAFKVNPLLSGLSEEMLSQYRNLAAQKYCPSLVQLDKVLAGADETLTKCFIEGIGIADSCGPTAKDTIAVAAAETVQQKFEEILK